MNGHGKDQDEKIENLDLNDINLEVKIKPTEVKVENLDFETDPSISNTNTNVENNGFDDAVENLTDDQLSNEAFQDSKASDKMTTGENQDVQSAYDSPSNDQLQQSDDLVESGDQENSFDEGDLKEPEAGEKNNEQSSGENLSNGQSNGEAPVNDQTNSENPGENKESGKSQNDNSENKKDDNNLNNNSENKKDGNDLGNDNPENKKYANKDSGEKNNRDNGQNNSDLNNKKDQDTSKPPQDNKKKNENSSPSKSNNNKSEMGNKEKKPSGLNKKRDDLKNKWNNRPKTPKDFANKAKNGIKNGAKKRYNNSGLGKAINNGKKAIQGGKKAAQKTKVAAKAIGSFLKTPAGLITLGVIVGLLLIMILIIIVPSMFASGSPLVGGEVQEEENYNRYSEVDQKTIEKLKSIAQKYSSGNPSYAMAATLYPYIEEMQNGNVNSIRGKTNTSQSDDEDAYDDSDNSDDSDEKEDLKEDENDSISNDLYLELFRQWKYRRKFTKLLKESQSGDDNLTEYLKNTWFKKDAGYKELFDGVKDQSALADAIISDIQDQKDDFKGYFFENCSTTYGSQSAGSVEVDEMLKGNILVDVKISSCTTGKNVWDCESIYDSPIDIAKYVKGVTYEEIGVSGSSDIEKVKAQMVAAKSYVIGRAKSMGWGVRKDNSGNYIVTIRNNTNDQDYCDIDVGCKSGKTKVNSDNIRSAVDDATRAKLDEAWEATKNVYIQNSKGSLVGEFCDSRTGICNLCKKGTCLAHEELSNYSSTSYKDILLDQYSSYSLLEQDGEFASAIVGVANTTCSTTNDNSNFIYYAQNDYANTAFCGRSLSSGKNGCANGDSICTSGCGVTSAAMAVATLTQNKSITPETINSSARVGTDCGSDGTTGSLFPYVSSNNGLEAKSISTKKDIISTLDSGGLVIANVAGVFGDGIYKTDGGHYVVIRGYSGDNVYIADPWQNQSMIKHCEEFDSSNHCTKLSTDFDTFVSNVKNHGAAGFYAITGGISFSESGSSGASQGTGETTGYLTSPFGKNETNSQAKNHLNGNSSTLYYNSGGYHGAIDFAVTSGTKVYAMDGGEVVTAHNDTGNAYGKYIIIKLNTKEKTYYNLYAHLSNIKVKVGEKVSQGQLIALSGNTGTNTTGAHLHAELINSISCLGHTCSGTHYNVLKYIGTKKTYVGQKCDGKGC